MFSNRKISQSNIKKYRDNGILILRNFINKKTINKIIKEIEIITYDQIKKNKLNDKPKSFKELIKYAFKDKDSEIRFFLYHRLRSIPTLQSLCFSDNLTNLLMKLNHNLPACVQKPTIRFDFPDESVHKLNAHQDIRAIISSKCTTVWIPITSVNKKNGTIKVYKNSHKLGLIDHKMDKNNQSIISNYNILKDFEEIVIDANPGDVILMNSFCLHSSVKGQKNTLKINIQAFYNDLKEININDKYYNLKNIPDAGKKTMYNEYK